jgi:hypothetical protein
MANYLGDNRIYQIFDPSREISQSDLLTCEELLRSSYLNIGSVSQLGRQEEGN